MRTLSDTEDVPEAVARNESRLEQLDRNWTELLQELRVVQTGVQLLTGFLLTLPFQQRFAGLTAREQHLYLAVVLASAGATALLIAPVSMHRILFRQNARAWMVAVANWCALLGIILLSLALVGVNSLIFDVVLNSGGAVAVAVATLTTLAALWFVTPVALRLLLRRRRSRATGSP